MNCFQWNYIIDGISIHALRGEGDEYPYYIAYSDFRFQSTPSVGRATFADGAATGGGSAISIHALRGEGDMFPPA